MARRIAIALGALVVVALAALLWLRSLAPESPGAARSPRPSPIRRRGARRRRARWSASRGRYGSHVWLGIPYAAAAGRRAALARAAAAAPWTGTREALALRLALPAVREPARRRRRRGAGTRRRQRGLPLPERLRAALAPGAVPQRRRAPAGDGLDPRRRQHDRRTRASTTAAASPRRSGVVVVTINYRLGPLGWFRHAGAARRRDASADGRSGNFGTLDLDPRRSSGCATTSRPSAATRSNVTIFGESAGGRNVLDAAALAARARASSTARSCRAAAPGSARLAEAEHFADDAEPGDAQQLERGRCCALLAATAQAGDRDAAKARARGDGARRDRGLPARRRRPRELLAAYDARGRRGHDRHAAACSRDGVVLPAGDAARALRERRTAGTACRSMLGTNRDENKLFMFVDPALRAALARRRAAPARRRALRSRRPSTMARDVEGDRRRRARARRCGAHGPRVFVYRFDWDEEPSVLGPDLGRLLGAAHGFEIPFVFGHFDLGRQGNVIFTDENRAGPRGARGADDVLLGGSSRARAIPAAGRARRAAAPGRPGTAAGRATSTRSSTPTPAAACAWARSR